MPSRVIFWDSMLKDRERNRGPHGMRRTASYLAVALLLLAVAGGARAGRASPNSGDPSPSNAACVKGKDGFERFWRDFRAAVRANNAAAIARLTKFPFVVRWGNDDPEDPSNTYPKAAFNQGVIDRLLALQPEGSGKTMRDLVLSTERLDDDHRGEHWALLEKFEFRESGGRWRWTTAFTADDLQLLGTPADDVSVIPQISPLHKQIVEVVKGKAPSDKPLSVRHIARSGDHVYFEALESGGDGRLFRALLEKTGIDERGRLVWSVRALSLAPPAPGDPIDSAREKLIKLGVHPNLFSGKGTK